MAKVSLHEPKKMKIGPKIFDVVLIGYTLESNVNCFLVVNTEISKISNNTITEVRNVVYFENFFPVKFSVLVILLIILLHLIFTSLVLLQPRIQNQGVKELRFSKTSEKISLPILLKVT